MENVIDLFEMSPDGRIEQTVGVGNHSDPNVSALVHGVATGWVPSEACTCFPSNLNGSGNFFGKAASSAFNRSTSVGWRSALFIIDITEIAMRLNAAMLWDNHELA
jgi:hypothetical protein